MAKMRILLYIFSVLFLLLGHFSYAQEPEIKTEWKNLSFGVDLSRFAVPLVDTTRYGWEISGDFEILDDLLGVVEFGSQSTSLNTSLYNYKSDGSYIRFGVDYDIMKYLDPDCDDFIFVGLRYAHATFYHSASNITVGNDIWGNNTTSEIPTKWLSAQWVEVTAGLRANIIGNFYLGWNVRLRVKTFLQNDATLFPYNIPGFGRAWATGRVGFNYSIYYKIPLIKKKTKIPADATPEGK